MRQQAHRSNHEASSPEEYYRVFMYNEFLSHVICELEESFAESSSQVHGLLYLVPSECTSSNLEGDCTLELSQAVDFYKDDLPHHKMFKLSTECGSKSGSSVLSWYQKGW